MVFNFLKQVSGDKNLLFFLLVIISIFFIKCSNSIPETEQWQEVELEFTAQNNYQNPYLDVDMWVEFISSNGDSLIRPAFWYNDNIWKVRFASPIEIGIWKWQSFASVSDAGLSNLTGKIKAKPYNGNNPLLQKGLLKMSPGKRNVVHANGNPFLIVGDTPWSLPWRGTIETVNTYAENRQNLGFNTALLMSLQPDQGALGPRNRTEIGGFDVAFEDLGNGHINQMNPEYFAYFDSLRNILIDHGIVPVFQPVFQGFGWKGENALGSNIDPQEYARYCRYLVARYGAQPAIWLVSADSDGRSKGVIEGGEEIEKWDDYKQPTGVHYSPFCEVEPDWWDRDYEYIPHRNKINQDKAWLDFQWCQTGHSGEHQTFKVEKMYNNLPIKAIANGEPTYEGIRDSVNGSGWWQGHEAWLQFTSGGTMGVIYGAGGLWNWKLASDEPGWPDWANSDVSWKEAIELPGAVYVGYLTKALAGLDIADIEKHSELANGELCLAKPGKLYIVYLPKGGTVQLNNLEPGMTFSWFNPVSGEVESEGNVEQEIQNFQTDNVPMVLIVD